MPVSAPRICTYPGCNRKVRGVSRCKLHPYPVTDRESNRKRSARRRADPDDNAHFYNSREWRRLRARHLKANPMCADCDEQGRVKLGKHVDHITPIAEGGDKLDPNNLQTLCHSCHTAKTNRERGGGFKKLD